MTSVLLAALLAGSGWANPNRGVQESDTAGAVITNGATSSCAGDSVLYDSNGVLGCTLTTDVAPDTLRIHPIQNYPLGTQTAAGLYLAAAIDEHSIQIDNADTCTAGDTIGIVIDGQTTTLEYGPGQEWCLSGCTTQALRVTDLTAAIDALAGVSATESGIKVYVWPDTTTVSLGTFTESDGGCSTVASGTPGTITVWNTVNADNAHGPAFVDTTASATVPTLLPDRTDTTSGIGRTSANVGALIASGAKVAEWSASGLVSYANAAAKGFVTSTATGPFVEDQACTSTNPCFSNNTANASGFSVDTNGIGYYIYGSTAYATFNAGTSFSTGSGVLMSIGTQALTTATMTLTQTGHVRDTWSRYDWTNAMVVALGAGLTGDITVATLPAKTKVNRVIVVITGQAATVTTLTVACGVAGAAYVDYVCPTPCDAKAAVSTVYGDVVAEIGASLVDATRADLPSWTGTTALKCHFISTVQNLDQTTASTGSVYINHSILN